ncbi:zinc finger protein 300-like [Periplaneta americana]|uniref:zinc finger protein 300-like n=1 Tax=Periplaneta americana TaxID=6978 RepID=UPI0037E729B2
MYLDFLKVIMDSSGNIALIVCDIRNYALQEQDGNHRLQQLRDSASMPVLQENWWLPSSVGSIIMNNLRDFIETSLETVKMTSQFSPTDVGHPIAKKREGVYQYDTRTLFHYILAMGVAAMIVNLFRIMKARKKKDTACVEEPAIWMKDLEHAMRAIQREIRLLNMQNKKLKELKAELNEMQQFMNAMHGDFVKKQSKKTLCISSSTQTKNTCSNDEPSNQVTMDRIKVEADCRDELVLGVTPNYGAGDPLSGVKCEIETLPGVIKREKDFAEVNVKCEAYEEHAAHSMLKSENQEIPCWEFCTVKEELKIDAEDDREKVLSGDANFPRVDPGQNMSIYQTPSARNEESYRPFVCDVCGKGFGQQRDLVTHSRSHTGEKPFICPICGRGFKQQVHVDMHVRTHTGEKPYICDVCGKGFRQQCSKVRHARTHTGEKPFTCDICFKRFSDRGGFVRHSRIHSGEKPFVCDICRKAFGVRDQLVTHIRTHTGEKPFKCDICGSDFRQRGALQGHIRTHTGAKPFICDICGKGFSRRGSFLFHVESHSKKKPFACDVCDRSYNEEARLMDHIIIHTGEKPFKCEVCGKGFGQRGNLIRHSGIHLGRKPFKCHYCGKGFTQRAHVIGHARIHTGEKPFRCETCGKCFNQPGHLTKHALRHAAETDQE